MTGRISIEVDAEAAYEAIRSIINRTTVFTGDGIPATPPGRAGAGRQRNSCIPRCCRLVIGSWWKSAIVLTRSSKSMLPSSR